MAADNLHAEQIYIDYDDSKMKAMFRRFETKAPHVLRVAMLKSFKLVGDAATSDHMAPGTVVDSKIGLVKKNQTKILNIMTGRLARSLKVAPNFAQGGGGESEGIRKVIISGKTISGKFGSKVPYAAIHEYGGTINHTNLFGRGIKATITMPERPYLRPALKESRTEIHSLFLTAINTLATVESAKGSSE